MIKYIKVWGATRGPQPRVMRYRAALAQRTNLHQKASINAQKALKVIYFYSRHHFTSFYDNYKNVILLYKNCNLYHTEIEFGEIETKHES